MRNLKRILAVVLMELAALAPAAAFAQSLPGGFVYLRDVDPSIIQDIRYAIPATSSVIRWRLSGRRMRGET